ncbi:O-antigen ligase family protein [Nesterenkonia sp. LB17]|uniref:O-antigen ligase family protein n=1 Tax=unclassified Nesterenkonia TaxID=2629769 RepID=UPI001F4D07FD|nr:O-antigen ligase family protein [Nesterenkonia sp. DZ6]MCH8564055.1 O-antigen ligase family protein [Nesterenkonia sp. YGD6]MCH8564166.1 O-antigen ligase family protein [Nesterenkonia sp. LB17]
MRSLRTWFFYVYIACTLGANAVILISYDPAGGVVDNSIFSASWVLLHLISVLVLLTSRSLSPVPITIAVSIGGLVVLSAAWSVSPTDSLVYGVMAAGNILVACMLAAEYSLQQIARVFLRVLTVLVLAGMAFALVGVDQVLYIDPHGRANLLGGDPIRGFFQHNIMAGFYGATGAVLAMTLLRGLRRVLVLAAFILFVLWAGSATGVLLAGAAVIIVPLAQLLVPRIPLGGLLAVLVPVGVAAGAVLNQVWVPLLEAIGRDPTLTGRTVLWEWGYRAIAERPVTGWGFTGYFHSPEGEVPSLYVPQFDDYAIAHFHNSYIQTGVDLGLLGLLLLILVLGCTTGWAYLYARSTDTRTGVGLLMVMVIFLIASPTEFLFINYNHFGSFALFALFFGLLQHRRTRARHPETESLSAAPSKRVSLSGR